MDRPAEDGWRGWRLLQNWRLQNSRPLLGIYRAYWPLPRIRQPLPAVPEAVYLELE
jgi:hypothetical protein